MRDEGRLDSMERKRIRSGKPTIECLECGRTLRHMGTHLIRIHGLTGREYLKRHGLPYGTKLVAPDLVDCHAAYPKMKERIRNQFLDMVRSDEWRERMRRESPYLERLAHAAQRGRKLSEEHKAKAIAGSVLGRAASIAAKKARRKEVTCPSCNCIFTVKPKASTMFCSLSCFRAFQPLIARNADGYCGGGG